MHLTFFYVLCESKRHFQQVWQKLDPSSRFLKSCHYWNVHIHGHSRLVCQRSQAGFTWNSCYGILVEKKPTLANNSRSCKMADMLCWHYKTALVCIAVKLHAQMTPQCDFTALSYFHTSHFSLQQFSYLLAWVGQRTISFVTFPELMKRLLWNPLLIKDTWILRATKVLVTDRESCASWANMYAGSSCYY